MTPIVHHFVRDDDIVTVTITDEGIILDHFIAGLSQGSFAATVDEIIDTLIH